jgi:hypothetical protein
MPEDNPIADLDVVYMTGRRDNQYRLYPTEKLVLVLIKQHTASILVTGEEGTKQLFYYGTTLLATKTNLRRSIEESTNTYLGNYGTAARVGA